MIFVFGLGNPGKQYTASRHNLGFWVVDRLRSRLGLPAISRRKFQSEVWQNQQLLLAAPQTFMNRSGEAVREAIDFYHLREQPEWGKQVWVVHDDLDLEVGQTKIQFGKGPKGHNGLGSIDQHLGSDAYWHVRIGVDGRGGDRSIPPEQYVLSGFSPEERAKLDPALNALVEELSHALTDAEKK